MTVRVGINGFGRIGRQSLRAIIERTPEVEVVAVNDLVDAEMNALLFKHDSTYGAYPGTVDHTDDALIVDGREIKVFKEADPAALPWGDLGVDIVLESTGKFRDPGKSQAHLDAGAKKVIVSAPASGADFTVVIGVNEDRYDPERHHIISNASCTTNCLVPAVKVVHDLVTIERGLMNTVHSYTTSQRLLDTAHKDPRRARAAAQNIVPTTSGATRSLGVVMPELEGKFDGFSLRVPTPTVSVVDFTADVSRPTSVEELNAAFRAAEAGPMKGILGVSDEPLVSSDFRGDSRSSIIDSSMTMVIGGTLVKVIAWYDNEWGFSCRVADLIGLVAAKLPVASRCVSEATPASPTSRAEARDMEPSGPRGPARPTRVRTTRCETRCPVAHSEVMGWSLFRHADVTAVTGDPVAFSSATRRLAIPNGMDPPEHTDYRGSLEPYFTSDRLAALRTTKPPDRSRSAGRDGRPSPGRGDRRVRRPVRPSGAVRLHGLASRGLEPDQRLDAWQPGGCVPERPRGRRTVGSRVCRLCDRDPAGATCRGLVKRSDERSGPCHGSRRRPQRRADRRPSADLDGRPRNRGRGAGHRDPVSRGRRRASDQTAVRA